jgi:hypothetical protein
LAALDLLPPDLAALELLPPDLAALELLPPDFLLFDEREEDLPELFCVAKVPSVDRGTLIVLPDPPGAERPSACASAPNPCGCRTFR